MTPAEMEVYRRITRQVWETGAPIDGCLFVPDTLYARLGAGRVCGVMVEPESRSDEVSAARQRKALALATLTTEQREALGLEVVTRK